MEQIKLQGANKPIADQIECLIQIIELNPVLNHIFTCAEKLNLANYYIGAGCITQSV